MMNPLLKEEWISRILSYKAMPFSDRPSPEYLLDEMYEEITGDKLMYLNKYEIRDKNGEIPLYVSFGPNDRVHAKTAEWAGLDSQEIKLPSYNKIGGYNIAYANRTLVAVWNYGRIREVKIKTVSGMKKKEIISDRPITIAEVCELINRDV